jgi:ubiquinone/menaquinone biosynthesis C-methylase UbiE
VSEYIKTEYRELANNAGLLNNRKGMALSGYTEKQLDSLPPKALMGLACGNPVAACNLKTGMKTLDLGCGSGADVLLAALKVQPGLAMGVDFLPEMIERAKSCANKCVNLQKGVAQFEELDISTGLVKFEKAFFDYVTSNCCICLVDQREVFNNVHRILKPGGSLIFCEVAYKNQSMLPLDVQKCIEEAIEKNIAPRNDASVASKIFRVYVTLFKQNAIDEKKTFQLLQSSGFEAAKITKRRTQPQKYFQVPKMKSDRVSGQEVQAFVSMLGKKLEHIDVNDYMSYVTIQAQKSK